MSCKCTHQKKKKKLTTHGNHFSFGVILPHFFAFQSIALEIFQSKTNIVYIEMPSNVLEMYFSENLETI